MDLERTISGLQLNIGEAEAGRVWLLLPEVSRTGVAARSYPLPDSRDEIDRLAAVAIPAASTNSPRGERAARVYLCRARKAANMMTTRRQRKILRSARIEASMCETNSRFKAAIRESKQEVAKAIEEVRAQAQEAIASLNDLFALGRKGLDAQMRAHMEGREWQGERIDADAFRQCFRMVSIAVKGLGLPSEQRQSATKAVMDQLAESIKTTQDAVASGPGEEDETTH